MTDMILRRALAAAGTTVLAQSDPIAARMALMKANNDNARNVGQMIRGQALFDAAKVDAAFVQCAETAQKLPGLFPENSKTGEKSRRPEDLGQQGGLRRQGGRIRQGGGRQSRRGQDLAGRTQGGVQAGQRRLRRLPQGLSFVAALDPEAESCFASRS
jgi:hypothetical protein